MHTINPHTCPSCGAPRDANGLVCPNCEIGYPSAYTGPTQTLSYGGMKLAAPGAIGIVDPATRDAVLHELARSGDHDGAIKLVIATYNCHWDVARQTVEQIVAQPAPLAPPLLPTAALMALQVLAVILLIVTVAVWLWR